MTDGIEKLQSDLEVMAFMVSKMEGYLASNNLFGPTDGKMPKTTLGGFLMRQYRLGALKSLLDTAVKERLATINASFNDILQEHVVRTEKKGGEEFSARLRQWEAYVRDVRRDAKSHGAYYATAVEPRAMMAELYKLLSKHPYQFDTKLKERLDLLDSGLNGVWEPGEFVWPDSWAVAYPVEPYWWLYGQPVKSELSM